MGRGRPRVGLREQGGNRVGYFDTRDQAFTMHEIPGGRMHPYSIVVHDDQPRIALFGTHRLATVADGEDRFWIVDQDEVEALTGKPVEHGRVRGRSTTCASAAEACGGRIIEAIEKVTRYYRDIGF